MTRRFFLLLTALLLAAPAIDRAQTQPGADVPKIEFEKYTLPNGLEVILSEDHRLPLVSVNLWYHVGPVNEEPGRTGFAHLFEHMMFQGSKHVPGDSHFKLLEAAGGTDLNGTTDFDRTNYFETVPSNQLELALWLESDRMGFLLDKVDQPSLSNQQDVVRNERRQSLENVPYGIVEEALYHQLFAKTHPYYAAVIGSHADIQAAKLEDVKKFFKTYYAPNNASLAIVGDIDKAQTRRLVEKYFGPLKKGAPVPKVTVTTPPIASERRAVVKDRVELPRVYMAWITSPFFKPGDADADIAARVLGGGKSSRLYKSLVYDKQIAQDVNVDQQSLTLGSIFQITVTARPGHTAEQIEAAIDAELDKFRTDGPDAREVERARNGIETQLLQGLETLGGFGGVSDQLNLYNHHLGDPGYLPKDLARYREVTPASARAFAAGQLAKNRRVVVHGVPGEPDFGPATPTPPPSQAAPGTGAESINTAEPWRAEIPKPGPPPVLNLPLPKSFQLANGLTVIYSQRTGMPIVAANLVVKTGSDANPIDKPGLANFTIAMIDEGTSTRNALQIADEVAQIGASLSTTSTMDASTVAVRSLRKNVAAAFDLMADVTLRPNFPQEEIERQRASRLASLVQQREDPSTVASKVMVAALYGPKHAYGYTEIGTEGSVKGISRDDMQGFWKQNFVPNNAALIVAGPLGEAEIRQLAEKTFAAWQRGAPAPRNLGTPATTSARVIIVDKPGAQQTQLRVAAIGVPRSTPDYAPLRVTNEALGGLFSSRINLNLREQHGYTYGAGSQFVFRKGAGPFAVLTGVRTDVTAPAITEIMKELDRIVEAPLSRDELTMSKDALVRSLPSDFETSGNTVASMSNLFVYDLGLDYYTKYPAQMSAVDAEGAQRAARTHIAPGRMVIVAVGDRSKIEPELRKLNLGQIEIWTADAQPAGAR